MLDEAGVRSLLDIFDVTDIRVYNGRRLTLRCNTHVQKRLINKLMIDKFNAYPTVWTQIALESSHLSFMAYEVKHETK